MANAYFTDRSLVPLEKFIGRHRFCRRRRGLIGAKRGRRGHGGQ
jgi:hypothetical protein